MSFINHDGIKKDEKVSSSSECCNCKESVVFGERAYCSVDGYFRPLHKETDCKNFNQKAKH